MGLYRRVIEEKERLGPEEKKEEKDPKEEARKRERMAAYIRRKALEGLPSGPGPYGYLTREDLMKERTKYIDDLKLMADLMVRGIWGRGEAGKFAGLRNKYPVEYAELRTIYYPSKRSVRRD